MALTSPRFAANTALQNAARNSPPMVQGASGHGVHLLQMALIDLGFSMPKSTGKVQYSPDGIFGNETVSVVKEFQSQQKLKADGKVGQNTMEALNRLFPLHQHRVKLHFRSLALTDVPFGRILADTEAVYSQYGIRVEFANGESIGLSKEEADELDRIDQNCKWELSDGEFAKLHRLGTPAPQSDVLVYFIRTFQQPTLLGCGGHAVKRPACTLAARANRWDTAHELGHVLLGSSFSPVHLEDTRNLMFKFSQTSARLPALTVAQLRQMRTSPCCVAV